MYGYCGADLLLYNVLYDVRKLALASLQWTQIRLQLKSHAGARKNGDRKRRSLCMVLQSSDERAEDYGNRLGPFIPFIRYSQVCWVAIADVKRPFRL